jgi:hypothetical protein
MNRENPIRIRRWLIVLLVVQIALALVAGGTAWAARNNKPSPPSTTPDPDSVTRPLTVETGYQLGLEQANKWQPNATLLNINMQVDWPNDPPPATVIALPGGGWVTMTFAASWNKGDSEAATLGLFFERGSGRLYDQSETEWEHSPSKSISPEQAQVDSTTALLAAELSGGTAYRAECPKVRNNTRITLTTGDVDSHEINGKLVWLITYKDARTRDVGYKVVVDAHTGDIAQITDTRGSCEEKE